MAQPGSGSGSASASNNPLKRLRTNSIDESNATARHFTGHAQLMNRWKALATDSALSPSAATSTLPSSARSPRPRPALTRAVTAISSTRTEENPPPQSPLQSDQSTPTEHPSRSLTLPTTSMAPQPPTSTAQVPRPSSTVSTSHPKRHAVSRGLPSPAPSDENTSSPLISTNPGPLLQQNTRAVNPADTLLTRSPATLNYDLPAWQSSHAPPQSHGPSPLHQSAPQGNHPRRVSVPANPLQVPNQRILPSSQVHNMTAGTPRRTASATAAPALTPLLSGQRSIPVYFDIRALANSIMGLERQLRGSQQARQQHQTELSRLYIMRLALDYDDWFYLILHQLNCLRTVAPTSLPDNIKRLGDQPFRCLENLLTSNVRLNPDFLHWSSQFPLAIIDIYSNDNLRDAYRETALQVQIFLAALSQHWSSWRQLCGSQGAPPLVQDMVLLLHLPSTVLQGIVFKSIGRLVLGNVPDTEDVLNALDEVHQADRRWHQSGGTRSPPQVNLANTAMISAFREAFNFVQARRSGKLPASVAFQVPLQIRHIINPLMFPVLFQQPPPRRQNQVDTISIPTTGAPASMASEPSGPPIARYIFPRKGDQSRAQPMHPDPNRAALHQARVRSPALLNDVPEGSPGLYRYVEAFVMAPTRLNADRFCRDIHFEVTQQLFDRLPELKLDPHTGRRQRELTTKSLSLRLKCVKNAQIPVTGQTEWFGRDGVWPEHTYFDINECCMETRGKLHWGKYLPIDITDFVKVGTNKIGVTINRERKDKSPYDYLLAVELVVTTSHDQIYQKLQPSSRDDSMASMQKSLVNEFAGDDDVAVVSSVLTIDILDPISGTGICKVPVRGKECKHRNCFDLEVFLSCVKREAPGVPSAVDVWKCPICRGDVRPTMLIKDEFLMEVRQELTSRKVAARSIIVEADGTWKPKEESKKGMRSPSLDREETAKVMKHIEVVELD